MSPDAAARRMTGRELRAVIYRIAVTYLEVERGLRPPDHLAGLLSVAEYERHRAIARQPGLQAGPVRPPDVGPIHLSRLTPERAHANVLVRRDGERWSSLLIDLGHHHRGWRVESLDRLERLCREEPLPRLEQREVSDLVGSLRRREEERRLVAAAHGVIEARLDRVGDRRTEAARRLQRELDTWSRKLDEIDTELGTLERRRQLSRGSLGAGDDPPALRDREAGDAAAETLGPRPAAPEGRDVWDRAAGELAAYRRRWGIADHEAVLSCPVRGPEQAVDQRRLLQSLRLAVRELERAREHPFREAGLSPRQTSFGMEL